MTKSRYFASALCQAAVLLLLLLAHDTILSNLYSYTIYARLITLFIIFVYSTYALLILDIISLANIILLATDVAYFLITVLPSHSNVAAVICALIIFVQYNLIQNVLKLKNEFKNKSTVLKMPSLTQLRGFTIPFGTFCFLLAMYTGHSTIPFALRLVLQIDAFLTHLTSVFNINTFVLEILTLICDVVCIVIAIQTQNDPLETLPLLLQNGLIVFSTKLFTMVTILTGIFSTPTYIVTFLKYFSQ